LGKVLKQLTWSTEDYLRVKIEDLPEIEITTKSNLVINSYLWNPDGKGDCTGYNQYSLKLIWGGKKNKVYKFIIKNILPNLFIGTKLITGNIWD
jgi:hypothetical protein